MTDVIVEQVVAGCYDYTTINSLRVRRSCKRGFTVTEFLNSRILELSRPKILENNILLYVMSFTKIFFKSKLVWKVKENKFLFLKFFINKLLGKLTISGVILKKKI